MYYIDVLSLGVGMHAMHAYTFSAYNLLFYLRVDLHLAVVK